MYCLFIYLHIHTYEASLENFFGIALRGPSTLPISVRKYHSFPDSASDVARHEGDQRERVRDGVGRWDGNRSESRAERKQLGRVAAVWPSL